MFLILWVNLQMNETLGMHFDIIAKRAHLLTGLGLAQ